MEFQFDLNELFYNGDKGGGGGGGGGNLPQPQIEVINNNLIPVAFNGDKTEVWSVYAKISQLVDAIGLASARAQGLSKPITSGEKLKKSDHHLRLLIDFSGRGRIIGMIKTGYKKLYLFDKHGKNCQFEPLCVLDFYVHESLQRKGYGKVLYEHLLQTENRTAAEIAIDRPSEKFLVFLQKHYNLRNSVCQSNNFAVFEQFFDTVSSTRAPTTATTPISANGLSSPNNHSNQQQQHHQHDHSNHFSSSASVISTSSSRDSIHSNATTASARPFFGRYQHRPLGNMAQIIHNHSTVLHKSDFNANQPAALLLAPANNSAALDLLIAAPSPSPTLTPSSPTPSVHLQQQQQQPQPQQSQDAETEQDSRNHLIDNFDRLLLADENENGGGNANDSLLDDTKSVRSDCSSNSAARSQFTDQGFVDLKFYHSPLW